MTAGNDGNDGERKDGRRSLLVYMRPDVIKALKKAAIDLDRTAYSIVEEAVSDWITRKSPGKKKPVRKA
ncbi:hypothetical protein EOA50_08075 [Mesorhizobium sp. M1A.F.Ca.IN.020.30.1.1]|uniref:hypothetical protein n=1 Tax=Mesorhizobium sp. TaxID=1871066 RepID=UPI000FD35BFE|nr:hypothetical protein [Mesorhizobium sp.]RUV77998.1 hypothetical protein EOA50_08075 [Mesorhizobium sp. M1A.F.Ca.IN.020.30.1.1]RWG39295.1 MAG: hypothetical protein EOQ59_11955 [Mesorhizobium sp.]RWG75422.1 MAG: hypothetical protein EOQ66_00055 [Mesorhizobium sp.]TIM76320.1 MAG: hypothetical protein E5Y44_11790 [Mesorhizobium sp.]TIM93214.1 MAG: hypothetical protein E5Y43_00115 [Mesorhizobium sp.]